MTTTQAFSDKTQQPNFLENVQQQAGFSDIYDARDFSVVVFRTLRDLMTTEMSDTIAHDLEYTPMSIQSDKSLNGNVAQLWNDTNPLVAWLSRLRGPLNVTTDRFLRRAIEEGGLPNGIEPDNAIQAVFHVTKANLPPTSERMILEILPPAIAQLWQAA
jgi:uncharacterized protein (DUF2267 family)